MTTNFFVRLLLVTLGLVFLFSAKTVLAADGAMIVVTANPGKIMAGTKVLADVPRGTRLWYFKLSDDKNGSS